VHCTKSLKAHFINIHELNESSCTGSLLQNFKRRPALCLFVSVCVCLYMSGCVAMLGGWLYRLMQLMVVSRCYGNPRQREMMLTMTGWSVSLADDERSLVTCHQCQQPTLHRHDNRRAVHSLTHRLTSCCRHSLTVSTAMHPYIVYQSNQTAD